MATLDWVLVGCYVMGFVMIVVLANVFVALRKPKDGDR